MSFSETIGSGLSNLAGAVLNAPTQLINSAAGAGSGVVGNAGGFLGGLFNYNTGSAAAAAATSGNILPAGLQGSLNYGGDDDFLTKNKGLFTGVLLVALVLGSFYFIFGRKKKSVGRRRPTSRTVTKTFRARSVGKKGNTNSFKQVSQNTYNGYTKRQKNLYNLAKGRSMRSKRK
jgi:hypothetical protein